MINASLIEMSQALRNKKISSQELTQLFLDRINSLDSKLNSFISVSSDKAISDAKQADAKINAGNAGDLTGIPIAHKDLFCTNGIKTSAASKMLDNFIPPYDATLVKTLADAGMPLLGKTNLDEFAMGSSCENSYYGACKNPYDLNKVSGGSSGGSAVAVAARLTPAATGTDTGGSIRQPAAFCGITGIKPTYGSISRWGIVAYASSLDQAGVMAKTAEDCALLLQNSIAYDEKDSTSIQREKQIFTDTINDDLTGVKIGLPEEYFAEGLDKDIAKSIESAIDVLKKLGVEFKKISLPKTHLAIPAYYIISPAEASANLARYDGVRYGYRAENVENLSELYQKSRGEGFGAEVKRRILIGTYALSEGYYDAYFRKAQQIRRLISQDFNSALQEVDAILAPVAPKNAFDIGTNSKNPIDLYLGDIYTLGVNLAGLPGMSVPVGFSPMPTGMQLIGRHFGEAKLLQIAHKFQQSTDFHLKQPSL